VGPNTSFIFNIYYSFICSSTLGLKNIGSRFFAVHNLCHINLSLHPPTILSENIISFKLIIGIDLLNNISSTHASAHPVLVSCTLTLFTCNDALSPF